jgi:multimeric flavodoxin WrbA
MNVLAIYGNPKHGGFVHHSLDHVADRLAERGATVDRLRLMDADIRECRGCFACLRTGRCPTEDDMPGIMDRMRAAEGLVVGASVRNGFFPALYKRFYERITYIMGFGLELRGKPVLAIGAVGMATGKKPLGRLLTCREFQTHVVDYLFFRTGIPTQKTVQDVAPHLDRTADRIAEAIERQEPRSLRERLRGAVDNFTVRKFMLERNPEGLYDYIIERWKELGLM